MNGTMTEYLGGFDREKLSYDNYFQTLTAEMLRCSLINTERAERLQKDSMAVVARKIRSFCGEETSSLSYAEADRLGKSVYYTLSVYLRSLGEAEKCFDSLRKMKVDDMYSAGLRVIRSKLRAARLLHTVTKENLADTGNYAYIMTAVNGLDAFFKKYNIEYGAHENIITGDYPAVGDWEGKTGAEFIERYSSAIYRENNFLLHFGQRRVKELLCGFDNSGELIYNISDTVFANAAARIMLNKGLHSLRLDKNDTAALIAMSLPNSGKLSALMCSCLGEGSKQFEVFMKQLADRFLRTAAEAGDRLSLVYLISE